MCWGAASPQFPDDVDAATIPARPGVRLPVRKYVRLGNAKPLTPLRIVSSIFAFLIHR